MPEYSAEQEEEYTQRLLHMRLNHMKWTEQHPRTNESVYFDNNGFPEDSCHKDHWFRRYCIDKENYDPFTGLAMATLYQVIPKKKVQFRKKSKAYEEFKTLVYNKGWISSGLPKTEDDGELLQFLIEYKFNRNQVRTKFNELVKLNSNKPVEELNDTKTYLSLLKRAPKTMDMIKVLKESTQYRCQTLHHKYENVLLRKLEDPEIWGTFRTKLLEALTQTLTSTGKRSMRYKKLLSKKYGDKENELKKSFAILHGEDDFHFMGLLSLLTTVYTREFYIRLNKWDEGQQSISEIVSNIAKCPSWKVMPDESKVAGKEVAERIYYVAGWALTAGKKRKQSSIVAISTLLSGRQYTVSSVLPKRMVDDSQRFGNLTYSKRSFFIFLGYLERISKNLLRNHNIVLFGNKLIQECFRLYL